MPLLNYGLFTENLLLKFPLAEPDLRLLDDLLLVFSRDIYVNKILRRRADYILPEYLPREDRIQPEDARPRAKIEPRDVGGRGQTLGRGADKARCGVLSSGGKESLLTYALLKEAGADVHPFYINESGGHWRTALPAYRYHKAVDANTRRVWTNVDRFYNFMLDHLHFIRPDHRKVRADTYPIRLCIFPFYVFALLPLFMREKIGNILLGSEFDDLRSPPVHHGIPHYFGIYDQHQDYDIRMNQWYARRMQGLVQWSAVRNISGFIVERILVSRYPALAQYQRSCHSCHFRGGAIIPCGECSKCWGVLLFLLANRADPGMMSYSKEDVCSILGEDDFSSLRLDPDEKDHAFFLLRGKGAFPEGKAVDHVEKIHFQGLTVDPSSIPEQFRAKLLSLFESYTSGYCRLEKGDWIGMRKPALI